MFFYAFSLSKYLLYPFIYGFFYYESCRICDVFNDYSSRGDNQNQNNPSKKSMYKPACASLQEASKWVAT